MYIESLMYNRRQSKDYIDRVDPLNKPTNVHAIMTHES